MTSIPIDSAGQWSLEKRGAENSDSSPTSQHPMRALFQRLPPQASHHIPLPVAVYRPGTRYSLHDRHAQHIFLAAHT